MRNYDAARAQAAREAESREAAEAARPSDTEEEELRGWLDDYTRTSRRHRSVRRRS